MLCLCHLVSFETPLNSAFFHGEFIHFALLTSSVSEGIFSVFTSTLSHPNFSISFSIYFFNFQLTPLIYILYILIFLRLHMDSKLYFWLIFLFMIKQWRPHVLKIFSTIFFFLNSFLWLVILCIACHFALLVNFFLFNPNAV